MHTYAAQVVADQATGRPLAGVRVTVEDAETGVPVQPYREGAPVQLVTGAHGLITEWQTDETTRRVALTAGPVRLTQWCIELVGAAADAATEFEDVRAVSESALSEARDASKMIAEVGATITRTEIARNEVYDPLFKGNGWSGLQQVIGRSSWVESDGTATVTINTGTTSGNLLFEAIPDVGVAAPTTAEDRWSMSVVLGVPVGSPELTLRAGVGYGPGPAVALNYSQTQTVAPGTSELFTVVNNAPSAGRTTALVTVRSGGTIPDGAKFTVSKPTLTKGPTVGAFIHGDMPDSGEMSWSWAGAPHASASIQTRTQVHRPALLDFVRDPATGDMIREV